MTDLMAQWRAKKTREDDQLHERLTAAVKGGRVQVFTDPAALDFHASPVHSPWDHLAPLIVLMLLALLALLAFGIAIGIIAMTVATLAQLFGSKHYVAWMLKRRTLAYMLGNTLRWQAVWHLGGVALVLKGASEPPCLAPKGDWRKFIRRNLGEAETDKAAALPPPADAAAETIGVDQTPT
jgi:hypothetical protein